MSDLEFENGSDQEVSASHSKLLAAVSQLDKGQRVKKPQRSEPSLEVSEFHLVKSGITNNNVRLSDLAKTLGKRANHADIGKKLRAAQKTTKILRKPLEKHAAARIKRTVGFEKTRKDLGRWDAIVSKNRTAEQLNFPLKQSSMKLETSSEFVKRFRLQSELEKALAALEPKEEEKKKVEEEFPMNVEEIIERRKEAAKLRAQQSYKEAKAHRQNKIKSKKFHRIQRKEKIKQQLKEFEELQKKDPEAALAKLEQLDKTRAEERMSLRHRSTGQWAKNLQVRAKYDKDTRQVLAQQLSISRELTQKIKTGDNSEDEEEEVVLPVSVTDKDNPWVNGKRTQSEIDDFISGYRKYWDEKNNLEKSNEKQEKEEISAEHEKREETEETLVMPQIGDLPKALNPVEEVIVERPELMFDDSEDDPTDIRENGNDTGSDDSEAESPGPKIARKFKNNKSPLPSKPNMGRSPVRTKSECVKSAKRSRKSSETLHTDEQVKKLRISPVSKTKRITGKNKVVRTVGTSGWSVSPVGSNGKEDACRPSKSLEIDDIFDTMEDEIQEKINLKLKNIKNKYKIKLDTGKKQIDNDKESESEYNGDLGFKNQTRRPVIDEQMNETPGRGGTEISREIEKLKKIANANVHTISESRSKDAEIDPNKFINVKPRHLKTQLPDMITGGDEGLDDSEGEEDRHMTISEAFAGDDVVDEFRKEKEAEVKSSIPENINLALPGWGSWGGKCIEVSKRRKRKFIFKFPTEAPRKDENKGDVIIIEEKDPKIKEHQVSELPFPFTSVKDFEASIRAPIGRTFIPENAHRKLIEPAVRSKLGTVIEPMDEESLINTKKIKNIKKNAIKKRGKKKNHKN